MPPLTDMADTEPTASPIRPKANALDIMIASAAMTFLFYSGSCVGFSVGERMMWGPPSFGLVFAVAGAAIYGRIAPCEFGYRWFLVGVGATVVVFIVFFVLTEGSAVDNEFPPGSLDGYFWP